METLSDSIQAAMRPSGFPPAHPTPKARDIMVSDGLVTFRPDQRLAQVIRTMLRRRISGAPVVDGGMRLLGVISEFDCMRVVAAGAYDGDPVDGDRAVGDLMSVPVTTIEPDLDLYGIAHVFMTRRHRRLPVVTNGRVVGQVSRRDVLRAIDKMLSR